MAEEKVREIAKSLLVKARAGKLAWEETADEDTFLVAFPDYSVSISRFSDEEYQTRYRLRILGSRGRVLEDVYPPPTQQGEKKEGRSRRLAGTVPHPFHELLEELFDLARRQALKVDETLDQILESLKKS